MSAVRNTKQKQLVLSLLKNSGRPLTAGEIYRLAVQQYPNIAKSTVYRNLENLVSRGEVSQGMHQNGESFYSIADESRHLHYMICNGCKEMIDFPECPLSNVEREIAKSSGFYVTGHSLQIYGYCKNCRDKVKI